MNSAKASHWYHVAEQIRGLLVVKARNEYSKKPIDLAKAIMKEIGKHRPTNRETHEKIAELEEIRGDEVLGGFRETAMYKHLLTEMREHYALRVKTQGSQVRAYMSEKTEDEMQVAP